MDAIFLVMIGGALGAGARYMLGQTMLTLLGGGWPYGTFAANIIGGLAMGLLAGWLARNVAALHHENIRLLLGVGVLGGFTTFSSYSLEIAQMIERGAWGQGLAYALASTVCALFALFAGLWLMRVGGAA